MAQMEIERPNRNKRGKSNISIRVVDVLCCGTFELYSFAVY
jgi:hypothetical protein